MTYTKQLSERVCVWMDTLFDHPRLREVLMERVLKCG